MIDNPDRYLSDYVGAGCETVIVHAEACTHLHRTLDSIRELGAKGGVALNPATPLIAAAHVLDLCDLVLVMTVKPGLGGQSYIETMNPKIAAARKQIDHSGYDIVLEVDGGISSGTVTAAGADRVVVGSALYKGSSIEKRVADLRSRLNLAEVPT